MKSQTLPWFVINIIGTITFVMILIAIITMQKNFFMTARVLDEETARMLFERELLTSPNCFAHTENQYIFIDTPPHYEVIKKYEPGVVDLDKLNNFYNFNCLRFDLSSKNETTYFYRVILYDINKSEVIFNETSFVYSGNYNCSTSYSDSIPVMIYETENGNGFYHMGILHLTLCYHLGKQQRFCEMKT